MRSQVPKAVIHFLRVVLSASFLCAPVLAQSRGNAMVVQGMTLVSIPGGTFMMGSQDGPDNEKPAHRVTVKAFEMSATEITVGQFRQFILATSYRTDAERAGIGFVGTEMVATPGANWRNPHFEQNDQHPVVLVSWNDAMAFCGWLSAQTATRYDLPTEAEWEYACRAGTATEFFSGDSASSLSSVGWIGENSGGATHPVGQKEANAFGLYDMHGNACELCRDWFQGDYYRQAGNETDPQGPATGVMRVSRGGGWFSSAGYCRSAIRYGDTPDSILNYLGFRVVRRQLSPELRQQPSP